MSQAAPSLYQQLGVPADADLVTMRQAYRQRALECHPDRAQGSSDLMARLNAAWAVLSDPTQRAAYDRTIAPPAPAITTEPDSTLDPRRQRSRKEAWFLSIRVQTMRLGSEAARSAVQALALRHRRPRALYEMYIDEIVRSLGDDIESAVRRAREAHAAPLDLALASALLGVRDRARTMIRRAELSGVDEAAVIQAELLDRIWDHLAHGVSRELEQALGGNPRLLRTFTGRRV